MALAPRAGGPRVDDIVGDVVVEGKVHPDWGLHLVDVNLAMGDLVALVREQSKAFRASKKARKPS